MLDDLLGNDRPLAKNFYLAYTKVLGTLLRYRARKGIDILDQDWDNLLILDACRYDTFENINWIDGDLKKVKSRATSTQQWLKRNFGSGNHDDVVYVSGTPMVQYLADEGYVDVSKHVHSIEHVWKGDWDDKLRTLPPEKINESFLDIRDKYPGKRFVLHYVQPHEPFLGEPNFHDLREDIDEGWYVMKELYRQPRLQEAYEENLRIVLEAVENLLPELEGKTVITSDHGELLERKFGMMRHPNDVFIRELQEVPWLEVET